MAPLHKAFGIKRVDVSTYQAVSGAGKKGMEELVLQMQKFFDFSLDSVEPKAFPHRIALNLIPHIDVFLDNDYTKEEMKMIKETNKIMHSDFAVSATCVRVPVLRSHSESITITFEQEITADAAKDVLSKAESVVLVDNPKEKSYPMPSLATDTDETYVGRIRVDNYDKHILHLWCGRPNSCRCCHECCKNRRKMDKNAKVVLMSKIESILFVCLGNICRSPLAEGIARDLRKKGG